LNAEIITIGDEILIGQVVDTNSAFISKELNKIGVSVYQITSVQDDREHILKAFKEAEENAEIIIITGGLGPTKDDITKHTIAEYFGDILVKDEKVMTHVEDIFKNYVKKPMSALNLGQAMVPSKATVLFNKYGTAPGMWLERNGKVFVSLPGVPFEMKALLHKEVIPKLRDKYHFPFILHKTLMTYGLGESSLADRLDGFEKELPSFIKLAYLPNFGKVRLRLSAKAEDKDLVLTEMNEQVKKLIPIIEDVFIGFDDEETLESSVGKLLKANNATLSIAESCTGGAVSEAITSVPGASNYFIGSVVSYNERIKTDFIGVSKTAIEKNSVVSAEVALEMAKGVQKLFKTDYAISITGNAGPTKDKTDKSVGVVFIAIATPSETFVEEFNFGQPREKVIQRATNKALELLNKELLKNNKNSLLIE
jgi:nicotinamide-nucleotide amidase